MNWKVVLIEPYDNVRVFETLAARTFEDAVREALVVAEEIGGDIVILERADQGVTG